MSPPKSKAERNRESARRSWQKNKQQRKEQGELIIQLENRLEVAKCEFQQSLAKTQAYLREVQSEREALQVQNYILQCRVTLLEGTAADADASISADPSCKNLDTGLDDFQLSHDFQLSPQ
mmetsp:Transcript_88217/g.234585  ORF Transcript_88217/g.234585 Transcript_88217/m.234585 type:complete len:121 (+) Transcript_88217:36-398(+)